MSTTSAAVALVVAPLADKVPKENDVVAGWVGFAVFMFLVVSVALLCWSFTRHMRKARTNFGVEDVRTTIPVAGTPEGDAAVAAWSGTTTGSTVPEVAQVISGGAPTGGGGRHRGTPTGD